MALSLKTKDFTQKSHNLKAFVISQLIIKPLVSFND